MTCSSDSIRLVAPALAAAQQEIENPPARHQGQIRRQLSSGLALIAPYRFASLGDGLALLRPILGRHGLSVIQATRIDPALALLILETRIIHNSGEWIGAEYPVSPLLIPAGSDPRDTGAALTYARRQSLFALIGIAPQADTDGTGTVPADPEFSSERGDNSGAERLPWARRTQGLDETPEAYAEHHKAVHIPDRELDAVPLRPVGDRKEGTQRTIARPDPKVLEEELMGLGSITCLRRWAIDRIKALEALAPEERHQLRAAFAVRCSQVRQRAGGDGANGSAPFDKAGEADDQPPGAVPKLNGTLLLATDPADGKADQTTGRARARKAAPTSSATPQGVRN
ncbi:ERF family protein [Phreatobacter sp.]|uniref:ERF family protein n=1 Tax=Phreatobacter sp. TaxID=1966341 RepID=UPI003F729759